MNSSAAGHGFGHMTGVKLFQIHPSPSAFDGHRVPLVTEALDLGFPEPELVGIAVSGEGRRILREKSMEFFFQMA